MFKKSLSIVLSLAMLASLAVGCGGSADGGAETGTTAAGGAATGKDVTLTVFDAQAYGLERYDELIKSFEAEHPGVKIEVQHAPNDTQALLKSKINSDATPDVFAVQTGVDANAYYDFAYDWSNDTDTLALFNQDAIDTGKDAEGKVKSIPWTYENMGLIYNKDLFDQAGITKVPETMTELEDACKKLEAKGITAFAIAAKENWVLGQLSSHFMMDKKLEAKGVADAINGGTLTYANAPNYKNFFKFLDLAKKYGPKKPLEVDWETSENMLANGQAAIIHMGDWCQATLNEFNPDANLAFMRCPVSENPDDATLLSSVSWTYIVNKDSENLELAKEYVKYIMTSKEGIDWMCNTIGGVPAASGEHKVVGALANDAAAYINDKKTNGWLHTLYPEGYSDNNLGPAIQSYLLGQSSAEDTIKTADETWEKK